MKVRWLAFLLIVGSQRVVAQTLSTDSVQRTAAAILDEVGEDPQTVDEVFDYLDLLGFQGGSRIEKAHANTEVTWTDAKRSAIADMAPAPTLYLRSESGRGLNAYEEAGYLDNRFLGSPYTYRNRLIGTLNPVTIGLSQSKYSWESNFIEHYGGFAELSSPIGLYRELTLTSALAGNYSLGFANGLVFGSGVNASRMVTDAAAAEERSFGVRGSLASSNTVLTGLASSVALGPIGLLGFFGTHSFDARVQSDTIAALVSSPQRTTADLLTLKNVANIRVEGGRIWFHNPDSARIYYSVGLTGAKLRYDHPYFAGAYGHDVQNTSEASVNGLIIGERWNWSGEIGQSQTSIQSGLAVNTAIVVQPLEAAAVSFAYHSIPGGFYSPFAAIQGSSSGLSRNSSGYYLGLQVAALEGTLHFSSYASLTSTFDSRIGAEKTGRDLFGTINYSAFDSKLVTSVSLRSKSGTAVGIPTDTNALGFATQGSMQWSERYEAAYHLAPTLEIGLRFDHHTDQSAGSFGDAVRLAVEKKSVRGSSFGIMITRFATNSFKSAIYDYQSTLPGSGTFAVLSGKGSRILLRGTAALLRPLRLSIYLGGNIYDDTHNFGSGVSARTGNSNLDAALQLDLKL